MPIYTTGTRVELHPATDAWMAGDRYGTIVAVACRRGRVIYSVLCDASGKVRRVSQGNIGTGEPDNPRFDRARFVEACETGRCKGMPR